MTTSNGVNNLQIFRQNDNQSAAAEAGEHLNAILIENKKRPVLLMLSAGSALSILDYVGKNALGENLTISVLDERFSVDPAVNNFARLQKTDFYTEGLEAGCGFFGTLPRAGETIESLAQRWETNLKTWDKESLGGLIIATLGMGPDGHTAGIFPFPEDPTKFEKLFLSEPWVTAYNAGEKNQYSERITTTLAFFKMIDLGLAFVCGPEKKENLDKVISGQGNLSALPALSWREIKNVKIFTDLQA